MSVNAIPVNQSNWTPISASYEHDEYLELYTIPVQTTDGYKIYRQKILEGSAKTSLNKDTIMHLPSSMMLLDFLYDKGKTTNTGGYFRLSIDYNDTLYYITIEDTIIKLTDDINKAIYVKMIINDDKTISFFNDKNKMFTTDTDEPRGLYLTDPLPASSKNRQRFGYMLYDKDNVSFYTIGDNKRFWAFSNIGPYAFHIRMNGYISSKGTTPTNNYVFKINDFKSYLNYSAAGLITDHQWVTYFNNIKDKTNNKNTNLKDKRSVASQHLIDNPYNKIDTKNNKSYINIANMKNIMSGEYNYKDDHE